jgi:hypothetical protein
LFLLGPVSAGAQKALKNRRLEVVNLSANPIAIAGPKLGKGETALLRC